MLGSVFSSYGCILSSAGFELCGGVGVWRRGEDYSLVIGRENFDVFQQAYRSTTIEVDVTLNKQVPLVLAF